MSTRPILKLVEQHAEDAAFLWILRDQARIAADYTVSDLHALDQRIEAHVDGLRVAGTAGVDVAIAACAEYPEPGEVFVLSVLMLEETSEAGLAEIEAAVETNPKAIRGVVSAIGWALRSDLRSVLPKLASRGPLLRMAAVSAHSTRRVDPGEAISDYLREPEPVRGRALRLAGELGRSDLLPELRQAVEMLDNSDRDWASWSGVLLGCRGPCLTHLKSVVSVSNFGWRALQTVLTALTAEEGRVWLSHVARKNPALLVAGAGLIGETRFFFWLADWLTDPCLAPLAAESMMMIAGGDTSVAEEDLRIEPESPWLELWMRSLPFPNAKALSKRYVAAPTNKGRLLLGKRPLMADGPAVGVRYRRIAALHKVANAPGAQLPNFSERRTA